ncbi:hypothetical protein [Enterococcus sp. 5H]|uniref:hypothetical protein n=1 Tax=Enterococcus sp. 5H TaxID=1229490 RepID=UPI0023044714|nr:hypothetical protein [Enterococcus sp. 5H]MDA9470552.1 hypothetical protein [Enterococcus sp. 5H]
MKQRKKILLGASILGTICLSMLMQQPNTRIKAEEDESISRLAKTTEETLISSVEVEGDVQKTSTNNITAEKNFLKDETAIQPLADNFLKNPVFARGQNSSGQTIIADWSLYMQNMNVSGALKDVVIGTTPMGFQNNYNQLIGKDGGGSGFGSVGLYKENTGKLEADLTGGDTGVTLLVGQTITTIPGKEYTFSADTWSSTTSKRAISIYNGTAVSGPSGIANDVTLQGDQKISASFVAKSTQTTMSVRLYAGVNQNVRANIGNLEISEQDPWIPEYSKWLDSTTNAIPKSNTFLLREMEDTEIVEANGLSVDPEDSNKYIYDSDEANVPRSIKFKNVGYYNGESISTKITLTPNYDPSNTYNSIGVKGNSFLTIYSQAPVGSKTDIKFEFFDKENQPIAISGYWNFSNLNTLKSISLPTEQIEHVYSVDRQYDPPIGINYTIDNKDLILSGQVSGTSSTSADRQLTVTYTDKTEFSYTFINRSSGGIYASYPTTPLVKVAIPDPQGIEQKITEITPANETELNYQFVQQIPYETPANSDQQMMWQLTSPVANEVLGQGEWRVTDEAGVDRTNLFTFNVDSLGNGTVTPVDIKDAELYNHYYLFERNLLFSGKEVVEKTLIDKDNGRYLDYKGNVALTVDQLPPITTDFTTSINFASTIDYQYLLTGTQIPVPGSENQSSIEMGLITHNYPIRTAPIIEDYQNVSQVPENIATEKVHYTKKNVTFNYEFVPGNIGINVPEIMAFKETNISVTKQTKSLREDPDWAIKVTDKRANSLRNQWQLTARLNEPFTNKKDQTLDSVLKFKAAADKPTYTLDAVNSVPIYQSEGTPDKVIDQEIRWSADTGFYLDFDAFGFYPTGDYTSVIEFSLESVPTS